MILSIPSVHIVHPHTFYLWGVFRGMDIWNWYDKVLTERWWFPILYPNGQSWSERLLVSTLLCADVQWYSCDNFLELELLGWKTKEAPQFLTSRRLCGCTIYIYINDIYIYKHTLYKYAHYIYTHILCTYIQYLSVHLPVFPPTQEVVNLLNFCQYEKQRMLFHLQQHSF